jgi:uncharacterized DUF497 family protein
MIDTPIDWGYKKIIERGTAMSDFIEWDPNKADASQHGVPFEAAIDFEWETAFEARDERFAYNEVRTVALGFIADRLHVLVFNRRAHTIRVISLRKANAKEIARYVDFTE